VHVCAHASLVVHVDDVEPLVLVTSQTHWVGIHAGPSAALVTT